LIVATLAIAILTYSDVNQATVDSNVPVDFCPAENAGAE
jgi:hypothetical protein